MGVTPDSQSVSIYPNQTDGILYVETRHGTSLQTPYRISVSNVLGQQLMETTADGNAILDMSRFEPGMYLIRIETENGVTVQKVNVR